MQAQTLHNLRMCKTVIPDVSFRHTYSISPLQIKYNLMKTPSIKYLFITMAIAFGVASCAAPGRNETQTVTTVPVKTELVQIQTIDENLEFAGVVSPYEEAHIAPAVPARIDRILVDVGDRVSRGQLLVSMDRSQLFQAQVQLANLQRELARMDTLLRAGAVTQQSFDQLKTQVEVAKSNIETLASHTEIRSTLNGVVTGRYFSEGELFSMTPGPAGKPAIISINQIRPVKVMVGVSERFFPVLERGQEAIVTSDIFAGKSFNGRVGRIFPTIDRSTGTFQVEILIDNDDESLRPGMFARVAINMGQRDVLVVPSLSVLKQPGTNERFVFVVKENAAHRVVVAPGRKFDDKLEIIRGLEPGQNIVTTGQHNLMDETLVEVL